MEQTVIEQWLNTLFFDDFIKPSKDDFTKLCDMVGEVDLKHSEEIFFSCDPSQKKVSCVMIMDTNKHYRSLPETCDSIKLTQELAKVSNSLEHSVNIINEVFYWLLSLAEDNSSRQQFVDGKWTTATRTYVYGGLEYKSEIKENIGVLTTVKYTDTANGIVYLLEYLFGHPMATRVTQSMSVKQ